MAPCKIYSTNSFLFLLSFAQMTNQKLSPSFMIDVRAKEQKGFMLRQDEEGLSLTARKGLQFKELRPPTLSRSFL